MEHLTAFYNDLRQISDEGKSLSMESSRQLVKKINDFLYTNYSGIGKTFQLGEYREYFSEFHIFWEKHHKEILDCKIDDVRCEAVADALHNVFLLTNGSAFSEIYDTCGLDKEDVCRVRFLTANQDFRGSLDFEKLAKIYKDDNSIFDEELIADSPAEFIQKIGMTDKSQNDKRKTYAEKIARFLLNKGCTPYGLLDLYKRDLCRLREDMIGCDGAGYGKKKTDMFLRDMVVLGVWENVKGFDKIDVASDVNTIKVALRTGIIKTSIPLVSSFLDIFCYQYAYIEEMNASAWSRVWEIWHNKYPKENTESPCLIDYFVFNVIGKQFCKETLYKYKCETGEHVFSWHSGRNKTCQVCYRKNIKKIKAELIQRVMPCTDEEGYIAIRETKYVKSLPDNIKFDKCPFANICCGSRNLQPPKSISIIGQTGWTSGYARKGDGGGGLMA